MENEEQVGGLLMLQRSRHAEISHAPSSVRAEAEFPETLSAEDQLLYGRLLSGGALDEPWLRDYLKSRAALRALGLKGCLKEIVLARGQVDNEIVDGVLLEAHRQEEEKKRAESQRNTLGTEIPTDHEIRRRTGRRSPRPRPRPSRRRRSRSGSSRRPRCPLAGAGGSRSPPPWSRPCS